MSCVDEWLTRRQAAEYLQTSVSTLARMASRKTGPQAHKLGTRKVLYKKSELDAYMCREAAK